MTSSPYPSNDLNRLLLGITQASPSTIAVSTDLIGSLAHTPVRRVILESRKGKKHRMDLGQAPGRRDREVGRLSKELGLGDEAIHALFVDAEKLYDLNPRGSWCCAPEVLPEPEVLLDLTSGAPLMIDGQPKEMTAFLEDRLCALEEMLPGVHAVEVTARSTGLPSGRKRTRLWVTYCASEDRQAAGIDTAALATHIRDCTLGIPHEHLDANLLRAKVWSEQLGTAWSDLPEVLSITALLTVTLKASRVVLRPPEEATAFWADAG